jgi:hypothetical protein
MQHFLLVYDVRESKLVEEPRTFDDAAEATAAYEACEREHLGDDHLQIVLVASDSLDTVRVTHGNFFERADFDELVRSVLLRR